MNGLYIYSHNSSPNSKILGEILFLYNFIFTEKFQKQFKKKQKQKKPSKQTTKPPNLLYSDLWIVHMCFNHSPHLTEGTEPRTSAMLA